MFGFGPVAKFKGDDGTKIELYKDRIECNNESHQLSGVTARVESGSDLESRVTLTRFIAIGLFALAFKKRRGGEKYLTIEGIDFAWMSMVGRKHIHDAMRFMTAVNDAARRCLPTSIENTPQFRASASAVRHDVTGGQIDSLVDLFESYAEGKVSFSDYVAQKKRLLG